MSYHTTVSGSLVSSGVVTLALVYLPHPALYWGVGLVVPGLFVLLARHIV